MKLFLFFLLLVFSFAYPLLAQNNDLWNHYWYAINSSAKEKAAKDILASKPAFDSVYARLKQGKIYSPNVKRGFFTWDRHLPNGLELFALILVPHDYTPEKKYELRIFLHGAVSNLDPHYVMQWIDTANQAYKSVEQIRIYPSGYSLAHWYDQLQFDNILYLLDSVKQLYNVDENLVSLSGASDGGTATYLFANSNVTPFCCFLPYISSSDMLNFLTKRQVFLNNFSDKPMFIVNGAKDQTYPEAEVLPYVNQLLRINPSVSFFMIDSSGHAMNWLPALKDTIDHFILTHRRNPFPDHLFWQTENDKKFNRNHWVVIDQIGKSNSDAPDLTDANTVLKNGADQIAFRRDSIFAIIDVQRNENVITVKTKNVKQYQLLLSPDQFDFSQPIKILTNNVLSFEGMINKDIATLLKWNVVDNDRTMLYTAEIKIKPGKENGKK